MGALDARVPVPPDTPAEDGGAITFEPSDVPALLREPRGSPAAEFAETDGGGATTLGASEVPAPVRVPLELTEGGGATTSEGPRIFPMMLLKNDPLPACVCGGGTTAAEGSGMLPLVRWRMSCFTSVEGGGAMTVGAGRESLGSRTVARSGAVTGGGTTAMLAICTGALESCRVTAPGAGGITFAVIVGAVRERSRSTFGAGATTAGAR
jgi:hypothetical protein